MGLGRQAKVLTPKQERLILVHLQTTRLPEKNTVMFLLSTKAGLRAKEISELEWSNVLDGEGEVGNAIIVTNQASKGHNGGREVPLNVELKEALIDLWEIRRDVIRNTNVRIIYNQSDEPVTPNSVATWFGRLYRSLGLEGYSSHSGRRTVITRMARKISTVGGSLRDVQELAGHSSIQNTQRYIDANEEAKRKVVNLI